MIDLEPGYFLFQLVHCNMANKGTLVAIVSAAVDILLNLLKLKII